MRRDAFLAALGRSKRLRFVLRHRDLGRCPKPRQARREACALWREGKRVPGGHLREAQSDPKRGSETMSATAREARMIEQPGHLGRRPKATWRREQIQGLCAAAHRTPIFASEQIQGLRAASAQNADICEGSETMSAPKGSVSPVGCCAKRKATRRRTAKRAVGAPRALRDD